jgi:hypothetical protein
VTRTTILRRSQPLSQQSCIMPSPSHSENSEVSEPSHNSKISVHEGHVALVLLPVERSPDGSYFYLEIPIDIINSLCLRPRKYLCYLDWCILGNNGKLSFECSGNEIDDPDGGVQDWEVYYYVMNSLFGASHSQLCCHSCIIWNALFRSQMCCRP